jgi:protein TonB
VPTLDPPVTLPPPSTFPVAQLPAPQIVVPAVDVPMPATPPQNTVTTTTVSVPVPPTTTATATATPPDQGTAHAPPASVRMAAMVDGCAKPAYPVQAARNGDAGTVTLALLVGVDGRVTGSRIEHSSGFRDLDRAALAALSLCTFRPAMRGDVAQAGWALVAYQWSLE